jgi:thioredoxin reductase (NADPH)
MLTSEVGNYPGFEEDILGPQLMGRMREQAKRFGTELLDQDITRVDFSARPFTVWSAEQSYQAHSIIVATGAQAKWLGVPGEDRLRGKGVSSCATCDGYFFTGKDVVVVGGGDTAMEEATFLTKFASSIIVIHRRDTLRASKIMQERAMKNAKISFLWDTAVEEIVGGDRVEAVKLKNLKTGETQKLKTDGVFVAIGHEPVSSIFREQIALDQKGYIVVGDHTKSSVDGVFVAGDVADHRYRQAVTAAGIGCMAAMDAERWLTDQGIVE